MEQTIGERYHDFMRVIQDVRCPFCTAQSTFVKNNGKGYYECKGVCKQEFFIAKKYKNNTNQIKWVNVNIVEVL